MNRIFAILLTMDNHFMLRLLLTNDRTIQSVIHTHQSLIKFLSKKEIYISFRFEMKLLEYK